MNLTTLLYLGGALFAGVLIPIQTAYNAQLARALHSPLLSAFVVFVVGLAALAVTVFAMRVPLPSGGDARSASVASWLAGGVLASLYVILLIALLPKLGAATTVAFVVIGQIVCSIIIDHHGWLGLPEHAASAQRLLGLVLMSAGVLLVRLY